VEFEGRRPGESAPACRLRTDSATIYGTEIHCVVDDPHHPAHRRPRALHPEPRARRSSRAL